MIPDKEPNIIYIAQKATRYSAIAGTFILIIFLICRDTGIAILGAGYILLAIAVNGICFLILLITLTSDKNYRRPILVTMISMLINIPLCIIYCIIAAQFI